MSSRNRTSKGGSKKRGEDSSKIGGLVSSYRSVAETAVLSSLLEDIKFENEASNDNLESAQPPEIVNISRLQEMLNGSVEELVSSKRKLCSKTQIESASIIDHFGDRGTYTGELTQGEPHGEGIMIYDDKRQYKGEWVHGRYHGKGKTSFANGDSYTGEYNDDTMHGAGNYEWKDGRVYSGSFNFDERQGHGVYSWPDGSSYTGAFKAGKMDGSGIYLYHCGLKYEGEFRHGQYQGHGRLVTASGRSYEGNFQQGEKQGLGTETNPDGSIRHEGLWDQGQPTGEVHSYQP